MNQSITLLSRPSGKPEISNFKFERESMPVANEGEALLKTRFVSVDPYMRGRMNLSESYIPPFEIDEPIESGIVAEVISSANPAFVAGDFVSGILKWKEYQTSDGKELVKVDANKAPLSAYLGILGMTGLTAYLGLIKIGMPKYGETLVVSGAAGAVGSIVGQIGKILGCKVIGIVGTDEKATLLTQKHGFDDALNYRTNVNLRASIYDMCPEGVDIYFDNVGGEISDAVMYNLNRFARVPLCGAISLYNAPEAGTGPRFEMMMVLKSILVQGFIYHNFSDHIPEALTKLEAWLAAGKMSYTETIIDGFQNLPSAFIDLFEGRNEGKMVVKI
ncbi:NADP-dependent oxidoreductase [Mucilaginibacter sp. E4BP6]|uniref:NADP-dependent oxidoreductase n=1 Tax=Mucilaginibacter sp. E4BP6 TaxID=2723089 RepID=UPI0015CBB01A|nr:NADP-dependent oxidoreductase [Mucilaginibacter sp. E4BP6]NYE66994.1 hypothetical protein [Mucilaginibacter sp. E4BP6]